MTTQSHQLAILQTMKTFILAILLSISTAFAESPIEKKLQQALFAEEATRDLDKAIEAYNAVITDYDTQRKFAATAIFRLAECHRKKNQTDQAIAAYQRLLKEFPAEQTLARIASENLASLGAADTPGSPQQTTSTSEAAEIKRLKHLIQLSPDLLNDPRTGLLQVAVSKSQLKVAEFLIKSGADINLHCSTGDNKTPGLLGTPLAVAASSGHLAMAELLLSHGAKLDSHAFAQAVQHRRSAILELLLTSMPKEHGGLISWDVISEAISIGRADYLEKLLANGGKADSAHVTDAIMRNNFKALRILLKSGVTPTQEQLISVIKRTGEDSEIFDQIWAAGARDESALEFAITHNQSEIAQKMIASKEEIDARDLRGGFTALALAATYLRADLVRSALAKGANPNAKISSGETPLILAIRSQAYADDTAVYEQAALETIDLILDAGADIEAKSAKQQTAFIYAGRPITVKVGNNLKDRYLPAAATKRLLEANPDPNVAVDRGSSPLLSNHPQIRLHAALNVTDRTKHTWLMSNLKFSVATDHPTKLSNLILSRSSNQQPTTSRLTTLPFDATITLYPPGNSEPQKIDYNDIVASGDISKDPLVALGSIVVIENAHGNEIDETTTNFLQRAGAKKITVTRGEHQWKGEARPGSPPPLTPYDPSLHIAYAETVTTLLDAIHAPRNTSDPTRIEVKRHDGQTSILNYLLAKNDSGLDLQLRDGDEIILHPVPSETTGRSLWLTRESDLFHRHLEFDAEIQLTLAEFISAIYADSSTVLSNPDLESINILRNSKPLVVSIYDQPTEEDGESDPFANFWLAPGDIIEIPEKPNPQQGWQQLDEKTIQHLQSSLTRTASFETEGGSKRQLKVGPQFYQFPLAQESGLRRIEKLPTPGDPKFNILGLSPYVAIESLGYEATEQLNIRFAQLSGKETVSQDSLPNQFPKPIKPFPLIKGGNRILISVSAPSKNNRPRTVVTPTPRGTSTRTRPSAPRREVILPKKSK